MADWGRVARRIRVPLGFLFAAVYLVLAHPTWTSIAIGAGIVPFGLALRAWASGHVAKNADVTQSGPYAYTRNPLYLGSIIIAIGFGVASRNWWIGVAVVVLLLAIYLPVIRDEERWLRANFPGYEDYAARVPRLFPRLVPAGAPGEYSRARYLKHREYNALLGALAMLAALIIKMHFFPEAH